MKLASYIVINKGKDEVSSFLANPENIAKWDRGVKAVEPCDATVLPGVGFEFTTVGHDAAAPNQGRMCYRIGQSDPEAGSRVDLVGHDGNARYFKSASWSFRVIDKSEAVVNRRSRVECVVCFSLRFRYVWLAPILFVMRSALHRDLVALKRALESA